MTRWLRRQGYAFSAAWGHLRAAPGNFFLNMVVLSMTLALPFAGITLLQNLQPLSSRISVNTEISVFVKMDASREQASALAFPIRRIFEQHGQAVKMDFLPKEVALENLKKRTKIDDVVNTLGTNPLPDSYLLQLAPSEKNLNTLKVEAIVEQLRGLPLAGKVQVDSAWLKRLAAIMRILRLSLYFLGGTLGIVVIAVTFNTIRLQVLAHRNEIWLMQLVGATESFIRRPFHYSGVLLGLSAGGMALGIVYLALSPLNSAISELAKLYAINLQFTPLNLTNSIILLGLSALLGWVGAALSIRRHLFYPK